MKKGWHLIARLGGTGARYPHVLVDAHGWCLRLGPVSRGDDKFYSRLDNLLGGLVEHCARRRLGDLGSVLDPQGLLEEVRDALGTALDLATTAVQEVVREASRNGQDAPEPLRAISGMTGTDLNRYTAITRPSSQSA
jgi:hypothetical protein